MVTLHISTSVSGWDRTTRIINSATTGECSASRSTGFAPWYEPWYSLDKRPWRGDEEEPPCRESNPGYPALSLVTISTDLPQLLPNPLRYIIFPSSSVSPKWFHSFRFSENCVFISHRHISVHRARIWGDGIQWKLWISSLSSFLHSRITSSLGTKYHLQYFNKHPQSCSSLTLGHRVSHPYSTTDMLQLYFNRWVFRQIIRK